MMNAFPALGVDARSPIVRSSRSEMTYEDIA